MQYINQTPNPSGSYPPPQSNPAPGLIPIPDALCAQLVDCNGFATLTIEDVAVSVAGDNTDCITRQQVTAVTPDETARAAWLASLPPETPPQPTETQQLRADVDYIAALQGVSL